MELKDKVIIISGGSGLIGRAIVNDVKSRGGIAINADVAVETDLNKNMTVRCNVTCDDSIQECVDTVYQHFGRIETGIMENEC